MRLLFNHTRLAAVPSKLLFRSYSSQTSSLIKIHDIPAPHSGRIRILSLSRPDARNAISRQLLKELTNAVYSVKLEYEKNPNSYAPTGPELGGDELSLPKQYGGAAGIDEKGPTRAVILASEVDSCFCAGADLKERKGMSDKETQTFLRNLRGTFTMLAGLRIPTISAVSSLALGGGLELALSTHFRVFASTAQVALPETRLGIIPGAGGTYRLPALIGLSRARDLILTGRRVSATEAYFLGIANRLVEVAPEEGEQKEQLMKRAGDEVLREALKLACDICEGAPIAIRSALEAVNKGVRSDPDEDEPYPKDEARFENKMYDDVVKTEDRNEALKAFAEKRRPVFTGH